MTTWMPRTRSRWTPRSCIANIYHETGTPEGGRTAPRTRELGRGLPGLTPRPAGISGDPATPGRLARMCRRAIMARLFGGERGGDQGFHLGGRKGCAPAAAHAAHPQAHR